ncbi:mitochondrial outer membrane protein SLC25A46 isoform X1 [Hydra vulgaris]|uniref:mitochondrial outer membrane protein SLC25A46 isoform X1 n=1 Tax=Hydra vulgaris TaxID=6087 RepID=UPI00064137E2|nr:mitochondrial outer membrane protein SLC25A46 [Hydra vulgaris]
MVFRHFFNMIGNTEDDEMSKKVVSNQDIQNEFLSELACKVNNYDNIDAINPKEKSDNLARISGFALGVGSLYIQETLGYPFIVLRRQCQLNNRSIRYHILPFSLFPVLTKIHQKQGFGVFWKGWGSSCLLNGSIIFIEMVLTEVVHIPRQSNPNQMEAKKNWKAVITHELLKGLSFFVTLPLYSACFVDTVQTNALGETRSVFAFLGDAFHRLVGSYTSRGHGRLLPMYTLIFPSVIYFMVRYILKSFITYHFMRINKKRLNIEEQVSEESMKKIYYSELMSNICASFLTEVFMFPFETVIVRLHLQGTRTIIDDTDKGIGVVPLCTNYGSVMDCIKTIRREEGYGGFFKGFGALILQYVVQSAIVKLVCPIYNHL